MRPYGGQRTWTGGCSYNSPLPFGSTGAGFSVWNALQQLGYESCLALASLALSPSSLFAVNSSASASGCRDKGCDA